MDKEIKELKKENDINRDYYDRMVNDAVETISKYGDFEWFVSDDPYIAPTKFIFPKTPCGDSKYDTCLDCPNFNDDKFHMDCSLNYDISEYISKMPMNPPTNN